MLYLRIELFGKLREEKIFQYEGSRVQLCQEYIYNYYVNFGHQKESIGSYHKIVKRKIIGK